MIEYLSFEGGGVKAYAYSGILKYFSEKGIKLDKLKAISGSSIGAFTALCTVIECTFEEFNNIMSDFTLPNFLDLYTIITSLPNLFRNYGVIDSSKIEKLISLILQTKNIDVDITFSELYEKFPVDLIITSSNVNTMETVYFSRKTSPYMKVREACKMSCSYPIVFMPTILNGEYYCDGGLYRNLPFQYLNLNYDDDLSGAIGFVLCNKVDKHANSNNFIQYLLALINGIYMNSTDSDFMNDLYKVDPRICIINIPDNITSMSTLTEEEKNTLIEAGYNAIKEYIEKLI
jgi:NTE family protein